MSSPIALTVRGRGPAILWIHAFPVSSRLFVSQFAIDGYRHIAPDLPGFGASASAPFPHSLDAAADQLLAMMTDVGESQFVAAGVSMGGYIALALLRRAPERLRGLMLCDTRETADTDEARQNRMKQIERIEREGAGFLAAEMLPNLVSNHADDSVRTRVRAMIQEASPSGITASLRAMASRPDSTEDLRRSDVPLLLVTGSEDTITPPSEAKRMASLRRAQLAEVDRAGHLACLEQGPAFNEIVSSFLGSI